MANESIHATFNKSFPPVFSACPLLRDLADHTRKIIPSARTIHPTYSNFASYYEKVFQWVTLISFGIFYKIW